MAKKIQRSFFRFQQLKSLKRLFKSIRRIQTLFKVKNEYKKFRNTQKQIRKIQKFVKHRIFNEKLTEMFANISKQRESVTKISAFYKMKRKSQIYKKMKKSANLIKYQYRSYVKNKKRKIKRFCNELARKKIFENAWNRIKFKIETEAATIIQKYAKSYITRKRFSDIVKKIQKKKYLYIIHQHTNI